MTQTLLPTNYATVNGRRIYYEIHGPPANTRLAIIPGTTHYDILSTTITAGLVVPFLRG